MLRHADLHSTPDLHRFVKIVPLTQTGEEAAAMTQAQVMKTLKRMGTAQNRKVYRRHGVREKMFGVSYANQYLLRKKIGQDHDLALKLWATGNHDAMVLATMIADPEGADARLLDAWVKDLDSYVLSDAFTSYTSRTRFAGKKCEQWGKSKGEWIGRTGWLLLAHIAMRDEDLPDSYFQKHLRTIQKEVHTRKNRVRDAMNNALIAIGIRNAPLEKLALQAAKKIGKVEVDHGETGCKTPDAASYIARAVKRKKKR
jgi:3-methyladenine DNA glycosylase AlkD